MTEDLLETIEATVKDLAIDFCYYDRKEDEELSCSDIEDAFRNGLVTVDTVVEIFRNELTKLVGEWIQDWLNDDGKVG